MFIQLFSKNIYFFFFLLTCLSCGNKLLSNQKKKKNTHTHTHTPKHQHTNTQANEQTNKTNKTVVSLKDLVFYESRSWRNQWGYNGCIQSLPINVPVMFTCPSNVPSEFIQIYQLVLIKCDTCMYRISRLISFKPFLPTCVRYQIHSGIEHGHDLGTTKNRWIRNQEILKLSGFIYFFFKQRPNGRF